MNGNNPAYDKERRYPRVNKLFFISYIAREGGEQKTPISMGRILNISSTGIGMEVFQELGVNSTMEMDIDAEDFNLSLQGKVIHSHALEEGKYYVGIQFNEPQEKLQEKLTSLL
jgi:c-di-GMP-binding flagellar brake protein YcgR